MLLEVSQNSLLSFFVETVRGSPRICSSMGGRRRVSLPKQAIAAKATPPGDTYYGVGDL